MKEMRIRRWLFMNVVTIPHICKYWNTVAYYSLWYKVHQQEKSTLPSVVINMSYGDNHTPLLNNADFKILSNADFKILNNADFKRLCMALQPAGLDCVWRAQRKTGTILYDHCLKRWHPLVLLTSCNHQLDHQQDHCLKMTPSDITDLM